MNPYYNIYSYSPNSNYQTNKISQYTFQNWNVNYYNNLSNQNQKNDLWNNLKLNYNNNSYLNNKSSLNNSNNSSIFNKSYNNNSNLNNNNQNFLNPYNFPSLKNHGYSIEKPKPTNYNSSQNNFQNNYQNKNNNIWNSSLQNNPISMYSNDYNKTKLLTENSNNNLFMSSYKNYNYNNDKSNYSSYNNNIINNTNNYLYNNSNVLNNVNNNLEIKKDNLIQNENNIITEKKEELIKENKPEITYDSSKIETWGDFTKYWIFLHHHNVIEGLQKLIYSKKNFFVFMYGTHDSKGRSWCSDCVYAEPNVNLIKGIIASKEKEKEVYFVNIPIDKEKKPFYKKNEILKMIHVPTLIYFEYGKEIRRIIQDELFNKDRVVDFVMKTYKKFY